MLSCIGASCRATALAAALALMFGFGLTTSVTAQQVQLKLSEARALASQALERGNPQLAEDLARGLLLANPKDYGALMILGTAKAQQGQGRASRQAAARAFRFGPSSAAKVRAAQLAAQVSLAENRPTLTQIWLRRAAIHAQTDGDKDRIAADYAQIRAYNPLSFNFGASLRPSNNVNNGADDALSIIDGVNGVGILSGDAQALSGTILSIDAGLRYRLNVTQRSRTTLGGRLIVQRVRLSDSAKEKLATETPSGLTPPDASDFGSTYAGLTLSHMFAVGDRPGDHAAFSFGIGRSWYGEQLNFQSAQIDARRAWQVRPDTNVSLGFGILRRDIPGSSARDSNAFSVIGRVAHRLPSGGRVRASLGLQQTKSDGFNVRGNAVTLGASYDFAQKLGPAEVSIGLTVAQSKFPDYQVGFSVVPGGRTDRSAYADLNFFFSDYDYAGFAPTMTLRVGKRRSNVSRFDSTETSVNFGLRSKF